MKDSDVTVRGVKTVKTNVYAMATNTFLYSMESTSFPPAYQNQLFNVLTQSGDRKRPNPQRYFRYYFGGVDGEQVEIFNDGTFRYEVFSHGVLNQVSVFPPPLDANVYNKCLSQLNDKIRGTLDLSVSIAQAGQVSSMVRDVFDIVNYVRRFPRHALKSMFDRRTLLTNTRRAGSGWLAYQYGWKPLAQDVYDTANNVLGGLNNLLQVKEKAQGHTEEVYESFDSLRGSVNRQKIDFYNRVEMEIQLGLSDSAVTSLSTFTSLNPASIAWELMPWSFVVDWVYDVGGYMRNAETFLINQGRFKGGYITRTRRSLNVQTIRGAKEYGPNQSYSVNASGWSTGVIKQRGLMDGYPFPQLPRFSADLGSGRLLNAAALLSQHLDGASGPVRGNYRNL